MSRNFSALERGIIEERQRCCAYCGAGGTLHLDHVMPSSFGGTSCRANGLLACARCNLAKNDRPLEQFLIAELHDRQREADHLAVMLVAVRGGKKVSSDADLYVPAAGIPPVEGKTRLKAELIRMGRSSRWLAEESGYAHGSLQCVLGLSRDCSTNMAIKIAATMNRFGSALSAVNILDDARIFTTRQRAEIEELRAAHSPEAESASGAAA